MKEYCLSIILKMKYKTDIQQMQNSYRFSSLKRFLQHNLIVLVLVNTGNVFNYLFQFVAGRALTPADYGTFNALNSFLVVLAVPLSFLPLVYSKLAVRLEPVGLGAIRELLARSLKVFSLVGIGIVLCGLLFLPTVKWFFHHNYNLPFLIIYFHVFISLIMPIYWGSLQGLQRFTIYGIGVGTAAFSRFAFAVILVWWLDGGINAALLAGVIAVCFEFAIALYGLRDIFSVPRIQLPPGILQNMSGIALPLFFSNTFILVFTNSDLMLVEHFIPGDQAGYYATAAIIGRIALFVPNILAVVLFPAIAKSQIEGQDSNKVFWVSFGAAALIGGSIALVCTIAPELVITLMFSDKYIQAAAFLPLISLAMACLALSNIIFTYYLARSQYWFLFPLALGVAGFFVVTIFSHDTATAVAHNLLGSSLFILACAFSGHCYVQVRNATKNVAS